MEATPWKHPREIKRCRIKIRETYKGRPAKPEALALNGKEFNFRAAWRMEKGDPYPRELALTVVDFNEEFLNAMGWIAERDVEILEDLVR